MQEIVWFCVVHACAVCVSHQIRVTISGLPILLCFYLPHLTAAHMIFNPLLEF